MSVRNAAYSACYLLGERLHQVAYPIVRHNRGVEKELLVAVDVILDVEVIGHERVPVVKGVKLSRNAVLVLEMLVKEELRIELKLEVVGTQVLHIFLNDDLDRLTYRKEKKNELLKTSKDVTWHINNLLTKTWKVFKDEYDDIIFCGGNI